MTGRVTRSKIDFSIKNTAIRKTQKGFIDAKKGNSQVFRQRDLQK